MSAILHRRSVAVEISALDAGLEFVEASADVQAEFLKGVTLAIEDFNPRQTWSMQSAYIAAKIDADRRASVAAWLETLAEYLRNPVSC